MKVLLFALIVSTSFAHAGSESIRDLEKNPLTVNEARALKAAKRLAHKEGQFVKAICVNASFEAGTEPVTVQFYDIDEEGESCVDPHYSIEVEFKNTKVISVRLNDA